MAVAPMKQPEISNVVELTVIDGKLSKKSKIRYNKDGSIDKRDGGNSVAGVSTEVYPFVSKEEIKAMIDVFDKRIVNAPDAEKRQIACRNKMIFLVGINLGIRVSDLCCLRYSFFIKENGTFKDGYKLQPKKTKKTGKFVPLYFNDVVKKAIIDYMEEYPIDDLNDYLFKSKKGEHITERPLGSIIKCAAKEAGIERNINSHSLRKTFGYWIYHKAADKNNALIILQTIFSHSSPSVTARYIGLTDNEVSDVFNELNLGLDFI